MCTVSWLIDKKNYQVFFNRDEQTKRALCLNAGLHLMHDITVIMPIDPDGKGSWITTNEHGVTLCLLNFYQGRLPSDIGQEILKSRGMLVKSLCHSASISDVDEQLACEDLSYYTSFTLLAFEREQKTPQAWQWNGVDLVQFVPSSPLISSGVDFDGVQAARINMYPKKTSEDTLMAYHKRHHEPSHHGVCMHRKEANTVSFSHVNVNQDISRFRYIPLSPCLVNVKTSDYPVFELRR
jgi:hypothetical protein